MHALGWIQTCDPSNQAPEELLLRPLGHRDRQRLINPLNAQLNPMCYLLALLGAHPTLHVSRIRVKRKNNAF
jgi:hypothetical protein